MTSRGTSRTHTYRTHALDEEHSMLQVVFDPDQPTCMRVEETQVLPVPGEGQVVVKPAYIAVHGQRTAQVVGEVVNINETPDLHVGDVVYSPSAPLHSLFVADATVLHKIDTTLDVPESYLSVLSPFSVGLLDTILQLPPPANGVVCVYHADSLRGRIAAQVLRAAASSCAVVEMRGGSLANVTEEFSTGVDVFVDCSGGAALDVALSVLRPNGYVMLVGAVGDVCSSFSCLPLLASKGAIIKGIAETFSAYPNASIRLRRLRQWMGEGVLIPVTVTSEGFEQLPTALSSQGGAVVKVLQEADELRPQGVLPQSYGEVTQILEQLTEAERLAKTTTNSTLRGFLQSHVQALRMEVTKHDMENEKNAQIAAPMSTDEPAADEAVFTDIPRPVVPPGATYQTIDTFAWDQTSFRRNVMLLAQGSYNSPTVTVYVSLDGVGTVKKSVVCDFQKDSFDLKVHGLNGRNFRLLKDNLEKDIVPHESTFNVKANKVILKLKKVKGEYSYDHWANLTGKRTRKAEAKAADPMGGLMDMMKDMYEEGDDQTRKIIGEAMMKARHGEKSTPPMGMDEM